MVQAIQGETYSIEYEASTNTIYFHGSLRLGGMADYQPIIDLLNQVTEQEPTAINLNLRDLKFLNSSGINMLSKFVIGMRKKKTIQVVIQGSEEIPWQEKSLLNLQRLMPDLKLELA